MVPILHYSRFPGLSDISILFFLSLPDVLLSFLLHRCCTDGHFHFQSGRLSVLYFLSLSLLYFYSPFAASDVPAGVFAYPD